MKTSIFYSTILAGEIKMSNCDIEDDFDLRSISSMRMKKLINSMEVINVNSDQDKVSFTNNRLLKYILSNIIRAHFYSQKPFSSGNP